MCALSYLNEKNRMKQIEPVSFDRKMRYNSAISFNLYREVSDMAQGFLEQQAKRINRKNKRLFLFLLVVDVGLIGGIFFAVRGVMDLSDYTTRKVVAGLVILGVLMLISVIFGLVVSARSAADSSKSLILLFPERTKEETARIIDREVAEGKVLVDEYVGEFSDGQTPYGDRILLLPSYFLFCSAMGKVTVIPRDKIYWICAQAGRKGRSSFIVRLIVFNEKKTFYIEGVDVAHVEKIADKLYRHIPNVFSGYDPFTLSYELDALFDKNRGEFVRFYEEERRKKGLA